MNCCKNARFYSIRLILWQFEAILRSSLRLTFTVSLCYESHKKEELFAMKAHYTVVFTAFSFVFTPVSAQAQISPDSPLANLYACKSISEPTARLACFDSNVENLSQKEAKKEIVAIDSTTAKDFKREAFGFSMPSLPKLGLPSVGGDSDDVLEFPVRSVSKSRAGVVFTMNNGQIWKGVNGRLNYVPKGDLTARISRGAVGSYRLSLSNGKERVRGLGVRRIE